MSWICFLLLPTGLFLRHSQIFTHRMMLLWGVICDSWGCWNRGIVHFRGFLFLEFKDIYEVNLLISRRREHHCNSAALQNCTWSTSGIQFLGLFCCTWANHYIFISSLTHQNIWHRPQRKAIISINLLSCLPSEDISLVGLN